MTSVVASFIRDLDVVLGGKAYSLHKKEIKLSFTLILHHKYTWLNVCRMHHIQGLGTHRSILTVCKFFQHASLNCRQVTNSAFSEIFYMFQLLSLILTRSYPFSFTSLFQSFLLPFYKRNKPFQGSVHFFMFKSKLASSCSPSQK